MHAKEVFILPIQQKCSSEDRMFSNQPKFS